jgi:concanavalin A-like lectin/glucanase superfamily protein
MLNLGRGPFSVDAWIHVGPTSSGTLLDKRVGNVGWSIFLSPGRRLALMLANGSSSSYIDSRTMPVGWHHIAVTVDRDDPTGIRFYVDGLPGTVADPRPRAGNINNNGPFYIGRNALTAVAATDILMDEIDLFDRVLQPWEIASIYNAGFWGKCK